MSTGQALGVLWDPKQDVLKIKTVNKEVPNTKHGILSFISSMFYPLRNFITITDRTKANDSQSMEVQY